MLTRQVSLFAGLKQTMEFCVKQMGPLYTMFYFFCPFPLCHEDLRKGSFIAGKAGSYVQNASVEAY